MKVVLICSPYFCILFSGAHRLVRAPVSFLFSDEGKEVRAAGGEALIATGMAGFGFIKAAFAAGKILTKVRCGM